MKFNLCILFYIVILLKRHRFIGDCVFIKDEDVRQNVIDGCSDAGHVLKVPLAVFWGYLN